MLSYRGLIDNATQTLYEVCDTPRIDAEYLMQHVIDQTMAWLIAHGDEPASPEHTHQFSELISQRAKGMPVAYLMGYRDFWTLRLNVNPHVLIPRGDTEVLVEQALQRLDQKQTQRILDLGTGSGAIALSIAKERPNSHITALDKVSVALAVAKNNAEENKIANVEFQLSDWYESIDGQTFDLIASNPPYIEPNDSHLNEGDLRFEPKSALIADDNGLSDIKIIVNGATDHLVDGGWILIEHGYQQAEEVESILENSGFNNISLYADLNHLPRCTVAQWGTP